MPHSASRASRPAHPPSIAPASGAANGYLNAALFLTYLFVAVFILLSIFLAILGEYLDLGLEPRTEVRSIRYSRFRGSHRDRAQARVIQDRFDIDRAPRARCLGPPPHRRAR